MPEITGTIHLCMKLPLKGKLMSVLVSISAVLLLRSKFAGSFNLRLLLCFYYDVASAASAYVKVYSL